MFAFARFTEEREVDAGTRSKRRDKGRCIPFDYHSSPSTSSARLCTETQLNYFILRSKGRPIMTSSVVYVR